MTTDALVGLLVFPLMLSILGDWVIRLVHRDSTPQRKVLAQVVNRCAIGGYLAAALAAVPLTWGEPRHMTQAVRVLGGFGLLAGLAVGIVAERVLLWTRPRPQEGMQAPKQPPRP